MIPCSDGYIIKCSGCHGVGTVKSESHGSDECCLCQGRGKVLSATGKAIVAAVQMAIDTGELKTHAVEDVVKSINEAMAR